MRIFSLIVFTLFFLEVSASGEIHPSGARSAGMGKASVTLADIHSSYNNPAALDLYRKIAAGVTSENRYFIKELGLHTFAASVPVKGGTFGAAVSTFGYSLYRENRYSLSFSKSFGEVLSFGFRGNYFSIVQAEGYGRKNTATVDFGLLSRPVKNLSIGATVFNPFPKVLDAHTGEKLPVVFILGAEYKFSEKVLLVMEGEKTLDLPARFKAGIEYMPVNDLFLRTGISSGPANSHFGIGWKKKGLQADVAAEFHSVLGICSQLSLCFEIK